jgi:RNA polymerase sigma-70 factor, ECF subfamily
VEKRRGQSSDARPTTECISKKTAPPVSTITSDKLSEAEAIQRAREGDRAAFEYLYRSHSRRVYALCLRMLGNTAEAEDLTQEIFLLLFRKIHTFRGESAFSTCLYRLAVNLVLMRLRKKSPPTVSIEANPGPDDETNSPRIDIGAPDLLLEGLIDRINLEQCIERLSVGYRTIFVLHDIQGYERREIAELQLSPVASDLPRVWALFPNQVIRADDLARAMVDAVVSGTGQRGGQIFENRDIRAMVESLHTHE